MKASPPPQSLMSRHPDSNRGPTHYECVALPTEPCRQPFLSLRLQSYLNFLTRTNFKTTFSTSFKKKS